MAVTTAVTGASVILVAVKGGTVPEPAGANPIVAFEFTQLMPVTGMLMGKLYGGNTAPSYTVVSFLILTTDGMGFTW